MHPIEELPLFVFGTLRQGERNHYLLEGNYEKTLPAVLFGFSRIHPLMIRKFDNGQVDGELYFINSSCYSPTMRNCDDLEGIPVGQIVGPDYKRTRVNVQTPEGEFVAWSYVHAETADE